VKQVDSSGSKMPKQGIWHIQLLEKIKVPSLKGVVKYKSSMKSKIFLKSLILILNSAYREPCYAVQTRIASKQNRSANQLQPGALKSKKPWDKFGPGCLPCTESSATQT